MRHYIIRDDLRVSRKHFQKEKKSEAPAMLDGQCSVRCVRQIERAQRDSFRKPRNMKPSAVLFYLRCFKSEHYICILLFAFREWSSVAT